MASERMQRRLERLLDQIDEAEANGAVSLLALRRKFAHPKLKEVLLATKNRELIENSPFDTYRVIGRAGAGKNRLGKLLMQVRSELMSGA